jgi:hypothetical protein
MVYVSPDELRVTANSARVLGSFETVAAGGAVTSKVYRIPRTRLVVAASVRYEEDFLTEQNPGTISMRLFVSGRRRAAWLTRVAEAEAEMPFETFGKGKIADSSVTTLIKVKGRSMIEVRMACRKSSRR